MEIIQVATAAAALLAPYLLSFGSKVAEGAAREIGKTAWEKAAALYQGIRNQFAADKDDYAQQTLKRLEEQPKDEGRQTMLATVLTEKAKVDPMFAKELAQLVQNTSQDQNINQFLTQVYDQAKVKNITNIAQAGVVNIQ